MPKGFRFGKTVKDLPPGSTRVPPWKKGKRKIELHPEIHTPEAYAKAREEKEKEATK